MRQLGVADGAELLEVVLDVEMVVVSVGRNRTSITIVSFASSSNTAGRTSKGGNDTDPGSITSCRGRV